MVKTVNNKCYGYDGAYPEAQEVTATYGDKSGTAFGEDPAFTDVTTGNFTIGPSATNIIAKSSGDPRWLPVTK